MDHFPSQPSKSLEGKSPIRPSQSVVSQRGWLLPAEVDELSTWLDKHKELMGPPFPSFPGDSGILAYRAEKSRWTQVNPGEPWWSLVNGWWILCRFHVFFGQYESPGRKLCDYVYLRLVWSSSMHVQCRTNVGQLRAWMKGVGSTLVIEWNSSIWIIWSNKIKIREYRNTK